MYIFLKFQPHSETGKVVGGKYSSLKNKLNELSYLILIIHTIMIIII